MNKDVNFKAIPYGDYVMKLEDFVANVRIGMIGDYDGYGYLATKERISDVQIEPNEALTYEYPEWCTHVVWYNR